MKVLVIFGVIAAALAAPTPDADADHVVAHHAAVGPYAALGPYAHHAAVAPVSYAAPVGHAAVGYAAHVGHAAVGYAAPVGHAAVGYAAPVGHATVSYAAPVGHAAVSYAAPVGHAAVGYAAPVSHAAVGYAAPVSHAAVGYAGHVSHGAVGYAAPVAYTQTVAHQVALPPAEVKVPVTSHHVEVPVHQKVHYGTQAYVAGATTTIHKPSLAAPAIAPPSTLLAKVHHNAPEVSIQTQQIPVERHTPNFVDTPYHAGTIIEYTKPEIREIKVPHAVAKPVPVAQPVPYAAPYAVPQPYAVPHEIHSVNVHQPINYVHHAFPAVAAAVVKDTY